MTRQQRRYSERAGRRGWWSYRKVAAVFSSLCLFGFIVAIGCAKFSSKEPKEPKTTTIVTSKEPEIMGVGISWVETPIEKVTVRLDTPKDPKIHEVTNDQLETAAYEFDESLPVTIMSTDPGLRDYYANAPLRVGTVGATVYHRPFCPHAKNALITHGMAKRVNYRTKEEVINSGRVPDRYCSAGHFEFTITPQEFAAGNSMPCTLNALGSPEDHTDFLSGKRICNVQNYTMLLVDNESDCSELGSVVAEAAIHFFVTNAIKNKIGDANRDADCDLEDYPFFQACYSSNGVAASSNCQGVFDYDADGDVDDLDFEQFDDSLYSGNTYWACQSGMIASNGVVQPKYELPLRVGIEGSQYYHKITCPKVWQSWNTHGIERRVEWYTWDQIEASGRIPSGEAGVGPECDATRDNNPIQSDDCEQKKERCSESP